MKTKFKLITFALMFCCLTMAGFYLLNSRTGRKPQSQSSLLPLVYSQRGDVEADIGVGVAIVQESPSQRISSNIELLPILSVNQDRERELTELNLAKLKNQIEKCELAYSDDFFVNKFEQLRALDYQESLVASVEEVLAGGFEENYFFDLHEIIQINPNIPLENVTLFSKGFKHCNPPEKIEYLSLVIENLSNDKLDLRVRSDIIKVIFNYLFRFKYSGSYTDPEVELMFRTIHQLVDQKIFPLEYSREIFEIEENWSSFDLRFPEYERDIADGHVLTDSEKYMNHLLRINFGVLSPVVRIIEEIADTYSDPMIESSDGEKFEVQP